MSYKPNENAKKNININAHLNIWEKFY